MTNDDSKLQYNGSIAPTRALTVFHPETESMQLIKYQPPTPTPNIDSLMLAYFLMFARAPRKAEPDADGFYSLDEIGADAEKRWIRWSPYAIARREP
jgi:hypothetical protein